MSLIVNERESEEPPAAAGFSLFSSKSNPGPVRIRNDERGLSCLRKHGVVNSHEKNINY
jgi:hypothetical protein